MFVPITVTVNGKATVLRTLESLQTALKDLQDQQKSVNATTASYRNLDARIAKVKNSLGLLKTESKLAEQAAKSHGNVQIESIRQIASRVTTLKYQWQQLNDTQRKGTIGTNLLADLDKANQKLAFMRTQQIALSPSGNARRSSTPTQSSNAIRNLSAIVPGANDILGPLGGSVGGLVAGASFAAGAAGIAVALKQFISLNAEIDDALAKLQKTGDLTRSQAVAVVEDLKKLDTRTTLQGLLEIGEELGKLGITITSETIGAVDKLVVALSDEFDGGANEVTNTIGKLRNLLSEFNGVEDSEAFLKIGNALNVLGASGVATAPVIANFSSRIAGVSSGLGLAASQILGVSAALQELGVAPERGASGFNRLLTRIALVPEEIQKVFKITNKQIKDIDPALNSFADLVNKDIYAAMKLFLGQLKDLNLGNSDLQKSLVQVGITGQGVKEVVGKLSTGMDILDRSVATAGESLTNYNSITKEAELRNLNLAGQIALLGNNIKQVFVNSEIAEGLAEFLREINGVSSGMDVLVDSTKQELAAINSLIITAVDVSTSYEDRKTALLNLANAYPEYFASIDVANIKDTELLDLQNRINDSYANRIALLKLSGSVKEQQDKVGENTAAKAEAEARLRLAISNNLQQFKTVRGENFQLTGNTLEDAVRLKQSLGGSIPDINALSELKKAISGYKVALDELGKSQTDFSKSSKTTKEAISLVGGEIANEVNATILPSIGALEISSIQSLDKLQSFIKSNKDRNTAEFSFVVETLRSNAEQAAKLSRSSSVLALEKSGDATLEAISSKALELQKRVAILQGRAAALLSGTGKPVLADKPDGESGSAERKAESEFKQFENAFEKYNKKKADIIAAGNQNLEVSISRDETKTRQAAIDREDQRFKDELDSIAKRKVDIIAARVEAEKALDEAIEATKKEISVKSKKGRSTTEARARLKELLNEQQKLRDTANQAELDLEGISNLDKEAQLIEHRSKTLQINKEWDEKDRKATEDTQKEIFRILKDRYDDEDILIQSKSNSQGLSKQADYQKQVRDLLASGARGKNLIDGLDSIDKANAEADRARRLQEANDRFKNASDALDAAQAQNNIPGIGNLIRDEDIDKLVSEKEKQQQALLNVEKEYLDKSVDESRKAAEKKADQQREVLEDLAKIGFDIAQAYADSLYNIEKDRIEREKQFALDNADRVAEGKLKVVAGNAVEEERIQAELEKKKEEINKAAFERQKELDIKRAKINAALAILKAYSSLDPISASIAAFGIGVLAAFEINEIKSQTYAEGGYTETNPSTKPDRTGKRPVGIVHANEYVVPERVLHTEEGRSLVSRLETMRAGRYSQIKQPGLFANGGFTGSQSVLSLSDYDIQRLADAVYVGSSEGAKAGTGQGLGDANRRAEREKALNKTLTV